MTLRTLKTPAGQVVGNPRGLKRPFVGPRQRAALRYIAGRKTPPTRSEIGRRLGITHKLIAARLVGRHATGWRNLYVTKAGAAAARSPN